MKTKSFIAFVILAIIILTHIANAQTGNFKVGVFDFNLMMHYMPGYDKVEQSIELYQRDSLASEYDFYQAEFKRIDSTFKADSVNGKPVTHLTLLTNQRSQVAQYLIYWQEIFEKKSEIKKQMLSISFANKLAEAYQKVLKERKYTLILKPNTYEYTPSVENIFQYVAKELQMKCPEELGGDLK